MSPSTYVHRLTAYWPTTIDNIAPYLMPFRRNPNIYIIKYRIKDKQFILINNNNFYSFNMYTCNVK